MTNFHFIYFKTIEYTKIQQFSTTNLLLADNNNNDRDSGNESLPDSQPEDLGMLDPRDVPNHRLSQYIRYAKDIAKDPGETLGIDRENDPDGFDQAKTF
jgi:hypothetical protein